MDAGRSEILSSRYLKYHYSFFLKTCIWCKGKGPCLLMSRGLLPERSSEGVLPPPLSAFSRSFSSLSSTLAASLLAFWEAFSSSLCAFKAVRSCKRPTY